MLSTKRKLQLRIMFLSLRKSGTRSLLGLGSVGLGIASMMVMLSLSAGADRELQAITDQMGKNLFTVRASDVMAVPGRGTGWATSTKLKGSDIVLLDQQIPGIRTIVPVLEGSFQVQFDREEMLTAIRGVTADYMNVHNYRVEDGRFIDAQDALNRSRVAVLGTQVLRRLNGGYSLLGETIWINGIPFEVVGELAEKGISSEGQDLDDQIVIPVETARSRLFNVDYLTRLVVQVEHPEQMNEVQGEAREVLRTSHDLDADVKDDFEILSLIRANQIKRMNSAFLQGMAQLFALVTLVIGGFGVLAVTYLNVKDRTPEIGLRMAVGARRKDVAGLFVAEACLLSLLGGIAGLLVGCAGVLVLRQMTGWQMAFDLRGLAIPLCVSLILGLVFSVIPAAKAAKVMPVEALLNR
jgi:putative ABC transport system permease protein